MSSITIPNPTDPLSLTLTGLWNLLNADPAFAAMVLPGNQVRFDIGTGRNPFKPVAALQAGDLPEVAIMPATSTGNLGATSSSHLISQTWQIIGYTGDQRWLYASPQLRYRIIAVLGQQVDKVPPLPGCPWVVRLNLPTMGDQLDLQSDPRGMPWCRCT